MAAQSESDSNYAFLLDTYETEILKITGIWAAFPDAAMDFRPAPKSRSVCQPWSLTCTCSSSAVYSCPSGNSSS